MILTKNMKLSQSGRNTVLRIPKNFCDVLNVYGGDYANISLREDGVLEVSFEKDKLTEFKEIYQKTKESK